MKEEWKEMKTQFRDILSTKESKWQLAKIIGRYMYVLYGLKSAFSLNSKYFRSMFRLR